MGTGAKRSLRVTAFAILLVLVVSSVAMAYVTIYCNAGVGRARLNMYDRTAASYLGARYAGRDRSYANQVVYKYVRGSRLSNGHYPLEIYSNKYHKVFTFSMNTNAYATYRKAIRVGSSEYALRRAYGSSLRRYPTSVYIRYSMGTRSGGTDFWVRGGRVKQIVVRKY